MVGGFDVVTLVVVNAVCDVAGVADVITFVVLDVDVMAAVELDAWLQAANVKITDNKPRPMQKIFFFISFLLYIDFILQERFNLNQFLIFSLAIFLISCY